MTRLTKERETMPVFAGWANRHRFLHKQPGSEDLCFITDSPIENVKKTWEGAGIEILEGGQVVDRTGAAGKLRSVYCRDPDGNLIE